MTSADPISRELLIPEVLNPESISNLTQQLAECERLNTRFVILKGSESVFCNGLDLSWIAHSEDADHTADMQAFADFLKKLRCGRYIVIAVVQGAVSGGGMGVVCACDHVIADGKSTFSLPEGLLGLIPGLITPSLLNRITARCVREMVFTGKKYDASAALKWGIADVVTGDHAQAVQQAIAAYRSCKPDSVHDIKMLLEDTHASPDDQAAMGIRILIDRLRDPVIKQRPKDISDFM